MMIAVCGTGSVSAGINEWTSLGPDGGGARRLAIDPRDTNILYAITNTGLFNSTDGGASWRAIRSLPPGSGVIVSLEIDPQTAGTLYVVANASGSALNDTVFKST